MQAEASKETQEPASSDILTARLSALNILELILSRKTELDTAIESDPDFPKLPVRDRAFTRMLVSTVLRRMGQIDDLILKSENRPGKTHPLSLQNLLRIGTTQLLFMDVPDHAAVDTSVRIAEKTGLSGQKNFVNAILRNLARTGKELMNRQDAARINVPEWLMRIWIEDYGLKTAAEIAMSSLSEAPLDITVGNTETIDFWAKELSATILPTGSLRRNSGGRILDLPGFEDGTWWIQDAGAAIPAKLFGPSISGETVIDLCAAPGGKTAQLASAGAKVISIDRSMKRLSRLKENLKRLRLEEFVTCEASDASAWKPSTPPKFILLDAPCTATGTIRRNPDILHTKEPKDLERLASVQANLLKNAAHMLESGGMLIYCTCSLQKDEGEHQIERLLREQPMMERVPVTSEEAKMLANAVTPEGDLRLLPFHLSAHGGIDGFFISRLIKTNK